MAEELHIVMLPWLAFGHMIPYLELSKCLAQLGHRVSFLSTPRNIDRLPTIPQDLRSRLSLVKLTPPPIDGLPEDAQSTVDVPFDKDQYLLKLLDGLEAPLCAFIEGSPFFPDWIIYDVFFHWAPGIAAKYGIRSAFFGPFTAMTLTFTGPPSVLLGSGDKPQSTTPQELTVPPPWVPFSTNVAYRYHEAVKIVQARSRSPSGSGVSRRYRLGMTFQGCQVAAIRSCMDFEPDWIPLLAELYGKPVFPVGLLPPEIPETDGGEDDTWVDQAWLDGQRHGSLVYVAFGSELRLSREQVHELAFGLELSQLPFFWAYRGNSGLLPVGFEDRIKGRGWIHNGWAPQARLLGHVSVGCFLMHGGWGSSIEGLAFGKPLVMLPMIGDQGLITRVMEGKKVGVEVPRNEQDGSFTRDAVAKCLKLVMVDDEGVPIRTNARAMMKIFGDKERHTQGIKDFVNYLIKHRSRGSVSN